MVTTQPWLLISVTTMRRLGRSVNADVIVIDGVTMGDRVVMGNGKFGEVGGGCCCCCCCCCCCYCSDRGLVGTVMGGDVDKSSLVSLRFCVWLCGVVEVLQLEGV
jgi:hypothetical protein